MDQEGTINAVQNFEEHQQLLNIIQQEEQIQA
jgi:hypothetical protein